MKEKTLMKIKLNVTMRRSVTRWYLKEKTYEYDMKKNVMMFRMGKTVTSENQKETFMNLRIWRTVTRGKLSRRL